MTPAPSQAARTKAILGQYGAAMAAVQRWEFQLAMLVAAVRLRKPAGRRGSPVRVIDREMRRFRHLTTKASPSELRKLLEGQPGSASISAGFLEELEELIKWRDFLAHRYLRTRVFRADTADNAGDLLAELREIATAFWESATATKQLGTEIWEETMGIKVVDIPEAFLDDLAAFVALVSPRDPEPARFKRIPPAPNEEG